MVIPEHLFEAVNKIQDTILICPPVVSQWSVEQFIQTIRTGVAPSGRNRHVKVSSPLAVTRVPL